MHRAHRGARVSRITYAIHPADLLKLGYEGDVAEYATHLEEALAIAYGPEACVTVTRRFSGEACVRVYVESADLDKDEVEHGVREIVRSVIDELLA